jgi:putative addiction module component (TIGR02574 family)
MPFNIEEIKKLSNEEKLRIIDELWESIEADWVNPDIQQEESPEVISMLEERLAKYEKGEMKSYTWEEVQEHVKKNLEQQRNGKK